MQRFTIGGNNRFPIWGRPAGVSPFSPIAEATRGVVAAARRRRRAADDARSGDVARARVVVSAETLLYTVTSGSASVSLWTLSLPRA